MGLLLSEVLTDTVYSQKVALSDFSRWLVYPVWDSLCRPRNKVFVTFSSLLAPRSALIVCALINGLDFSTGWWLWAWTCSGCFTIQNELLTMTETSSLVYYMFFCFACLFCYPCFCISDHRELLLIRWSLSCAKASWRRQGLINLEPCVKEIRVSGESWSDRFYLCSGHDIL